MTYDEASKIALARYPSLIIDPQHKDHPQMFCVRKEKSLKIAPFSVTLPASTDAMPLTPEEEETAFLASLTGAVAYLNI